MASTKQEMILHAAHSSPENVNKDFFPFAVTSTDILSKTFKSIFQLSMCSEKHENCVNKIELLSLIILR